MFVTGGTGAVGRHALRALADDGHEVSALARGDAKAAQVREDGGRPVTGDLFDAASLAPLVGGADAVVNLATAIPPLSRFGSAKAWAVNERVRAEGSTALVDAVLAAGVRRYVQESVAFLYVDGGDAWIDEDHPVDDIPLLQGNHVAEANAHRVADAGGAGVVLRFGWFNGPGATHSEQFLDLARRHVAVQMGRPGSYTSSINTLDAGSAVVAALAAPAGTYNVVDDEPLTNRAFGDALGAAVGTRPWLRLPGRAALLSGEKSSPVTRSVRASNARFREATGWAPRFPSAREALADLARRTAG